MSHLHVFDMDGTLLPGTTASLQIARHLGCTPELLELEAAFARGTLDTCGFAMEICRLWQSLTPEIVADVFAQASWIHGLADVMADIRRRDERSIVVTMSPDFFADLLPSLGVDQVIASRFPPLPFSSTPDPQGILSPDDKVEAVYRTLKSLGLSRDSCVAYGDSGSDIPLFRELNHTVAVNASEDLRKLARFHYTGGDLWDAYQLARTEIPDRSAPNYLEAEECRQL